MEKACRLTNTTHWDIAPSLSLPSLPVSCGALDPLLRLSEESSGTGASRLADGTEILAQAGTIAQFLGRCDVSYLNLKDEATVSPGCLQEHSWVYNEVLKYNSVAFELPSPGLSRVQNHQSSSSERKPLEKLVPANLEAQTEHGETVTDQKQKDPIGDKPSSASSRKTKVKKKERDPVPLSTGAELSDQKDFVASFCELVEDFCGRAEVLGGDQEEADGPSLSLSDIERLKNEISSSHTKKVLHLVPVDALIRLLTVLDYQIRSALGLSVDDTTDADAVSVVICALESTYSTLMIMTHEDMPKQLYKEEIIERILDFSRHQVMDVMAACDPSYRAIHKPSENDMLDGAEDDEYAEGPVGKKKNVRSSRVKKPTLSGNKISSTMYTVNQKLCSILGFLKDLLSIEKLSDSCILQLVKTSFSTFLADNIQLLQLKAIDLICGIFASYTQHRNYLIDETIQLIWKLPFSKRAFRSYHLPDDEQKQIQMITALLVQLVQCSSNLPESMKTRLAFNSVSDASIDATFPTKCHKAATETCCRFWTGVVERFTTSKTQDSSESKVIIENLVVDLLTTLNLPEFPASALILEVLCVLLLQNTGLKSKDLTARGVTIDLLGTIATRLKQDAVYCNEETCWIIEGDVDDSDDDKNDLSDRCAACLEEQSTNSLVVCHACQRCFHAECVGISGQENMIRDWYCHICISKKQLIALQSYCNKSQTTNKAKKNSGAQKNSSDSISKLEVIQQILLNYLQKTDIDDGAQLSTRWFYLCQWYKDSPLIQESINFHLARLKSKTVLRDFGTTLLLPRAWAKRICVVLGQKNSFARGFDKILALLLASLRENSPILRAKALRAVSGIVEVDPEVLCDKRVQCAVEGRFCDSAISVREAALELVGRHIASHPDVGLKYFEKVAERIKDTGVSVRKRAIKIIRDMCISNSNFSDVTTAFIEIISRVGDEESSIQDLVCKTFYEFWFEEPSDTQTQFVDDSSSIPMEVAKKTEQIVDLLRKMRNHHLLVIIIKRNLTLDFFPQSAKASGINPVSLASVRKRCELMCKHLLERILQVEEANNVEEEVQALPYILAVQAFCVVDPTLCVPATDPSQFVVTLEPYLKNQVDNRSVAQLIESIIFVIDSVLPLLRRPPQSVFEDLEQDLKHMIVRHSYLTVVHACIKCLCSLCKITGKGGNLVEYLIQVFFRQLDGIGLDNKQLLGRSLFCLGLLLRYGNDLIVSSGHTCSHVVKSLQLLKKYLLLEDFGLKARSLQALGFILIAKPEYMLEMDIRKLLGASLSSSTDTRIKMQALQNLFDYLHDVEDQMDKDIANSAGNQHPENMGNRVPVAAGAGDTNICGGIIQLYWESILANCLDLNDQVRQSALKIVEIVLRQGLVHPITCVPHLVALETDPQEVNSKLAHHLLTNMNEKYPSFLESRLGDGLQMSFKFFQMISGNESAASGNMKAKTFGSALAYVRPGVCRIYRLIRGNRNSRNKFMHSIVRKFEPGGWNYSSVPFLIYCTEVLASLPFTCPDEPLYLIYDINRVVQVRAGPLESKLKNWCSSFIQNETTSNSKENYEVNHEGGVYQNSEHNNFVTAKLTSEFPCVNTKESTHNFQGDCHEAISLQLLLKLKRHLKITYCLTDARCQAFSPKEQPKPGETLSRQNIPFSVSDTPANLPHTHKDVLDKYQELKQLLREDTMDFTMYTVSVKRKRPTPRTSRVKAPRDTRVHDDEDDDDDEDWTGGPRILDFGGQNNISVRVTRQRAA